jgi:hypothetical protein
MLVMIASTTIYTPLDASEQPYKLLILTTDEFAPYFQTLCDFHINRGIGTLIRKISDVEEYTDDGIGSDPEQIRGYLFHLKNDIYPNLEYLLLGGDGINDEDSNPEEGNFIPVRTLYMSSAIPGLEGDFYIPSDIYYGCLDGSWNGNRNNKWGEINCDNVDDVDFTRHLSVGRACVSSPEEIEIFIEKTIQYNLNKEKKELYLNNCLAVGELLVPSLNIYGGDYLDDHVIPHIPNGYRIEYLYEKYWYPEEWVPQDVIDKIDEGINFLVHIGHGTTVTTTMNEWDGTGLSNDEEPFFLFSEACQIGKFTEECFTETLCLNYGNNAGAFAAITNTELVPNKYIGEFAENLTLKIMSYKPLGKALAETQGLLSTNLCDKEMIWLVYAANLLGDPTIPISSAVPNEQPPTANFTIEPNPAKIGETVWFNSSLYSHDNDENGQEIVNWTWNITFNGADNNEYDCGELFLGEGEENYPIYNYSSDFTYTFRDRGSYSINLTVTDDEGSTNYTFRTNALTIHINVDLYENGSEYINAPVNMWSYCPVILLNHSFIHIMRPTSNSPGGNGNSNQNSSNPEPSDIVKILQLLPEGPVNIEENETVTFYVEVENGTGDNYVIWDFDDGVIHEDYMGWSYTVSHTYTESGVYYPDIEVHDLEANFYDYGYDYSEISVCSSNPYNW